MPKKIDLKKLKKVRDIINPLGKNEEISYSPLKEKARKKRVMADDMELDIELSMMPSAYQEGMTPAKSAKILKEVDRRRKMISDIRSGK